MVILLQWQLSLITALQNLGGLAGLMKLFSLLGEEQFFLLLMPLVYWCLDAGVGGKLAVVLLGSNWLAFSLKLAFHTPRPYWLDKVRGLATEPSYGLPSGHAQNATAIWLYLAYAIKKRWAWAAAIALVLLISLSRLYLGVHFLTDVFGGWIIGGVFLALFIWLEPKVSRWLGRLPLWAQVGVAVAASIIAALLPVALRGSLAAVADPAEWASFAKDARSLEGAFTVAGALLGVGVGLAMAARWARFSAGGPVAQRVIRFVVGFIGVLILWLGLKAVFPAQPEALALIFRYIRYALTTWWAIFLAPWVFLKTRLADPTHRPA